MPFGLNTSLAVSPHEERDKSGVFTLLAEFDHLNVPHYYETIEISVLGHN